MVAPPQFAGTSNTILDGVHYSAENTSVINAGFTVRPWQVKLCSFELGFGQPIAISRICLGPSGQLCKHVPLSEL